MDKNTQTPKDEITGSARSWKVDGNRVRFDSPFEALPGFFTFEYPLPADAYIQLSRELLKAQQIEASADTPDDQFPLVLEFRGAAKLIVDWTIEKVDVQAVRRGDLKVVPIKILNWVRLAALDYSRSEFAPKELLRLSA